MSPATPGASAQTRLALEQWPQRTVISSVRDQSACGPCWAFSSASSFEPRACISTDKDIKYPPRGPGVRSPFEDSRRDGDDVQQIDLVGHAHRQRLLRADGLYLHHLRAPESARRSAPRAALRPAQGEPLRGHGDAVPESQYQLAGAIKSSSFLVGGLFGYAMLIVLADVHYSWFYYAYLLGMFSCAIPSLLLLQDDAPSGKTQKLDENLSASLIQAYLAPTRYEGAFGSACISVFVFSLGTAPMFFLLLILRDLAGPTDPHKLQQEFSVSSILLFLSAAAFSVLTTLNKGSTRHLAPDVRFGAVPILSTCPPSTISTRSRSTSPSGSSRCSSRRRRTRRCSAAAT